MDPQYHFDELGVSTSRSGNGEAGDGYARGVPFAVVAVDDAHVVAAARMHSILADHEGEDHSYREIREEHGRMADEDEAGDGDVGERGSS
jgi:hypothetical protein